MKNAILTSDNKENGLRPPPSDVRLSVVIITFNEEKNITRCLDSVKEVADEIVVVDSFSTDQTAALCESQGVRFFRHPFEGFIEQKNWAVSQARFPHVLSIEGDEALTGELKESILEAKKNWTHDAYYFNRLSNYCGQWIRHSGWYPDRKMRLWDRRKGRFGGQNPHDSLILGQGAAVKHLKGDLLHYAFSSISEHVQLTNRYSNLKADAAFARGQRNTAFSLILRPISTFIRDYFFRLGFLDGFYGLVICMIGAYSQFLKYAKLRQLVKSSARPAVE